MRKCPYCAEEIQEEAIKCRHCMSAIENSSKDLNIEIPMSCSSFEFAGSGIKRIKEWCMVKPGLNQIGIKSIFGDPTRIVNEDGLNIWYYSDNNEWGSIQFDFDKKVVTTWRFQVSKRESDSSRFSMINSNMSQVEIVAVIGEPTQCEVDCTDEDRSFWTEMWVYFVYEGDMQKSCFIQFCYLNKKIKRISCGDKSQENLK